MLWQVCTLAYIHLASAVQAGWLILVSVFHSVRAACIGRGRSAERLLLISDYVPTGQAGYKGSDVSAVCFTDIRLNESIWDRHPLCKLDLVFGDRFSSLMRLTGARRPPPYENRTSPTRIFNACWKQLLYKQTVAICGCPFVLLHALEIMFLPN